MEVNKTEVFGRRTVVNPYVLHIRHRTFSEWLVLLLFLWPFLINIFTLIPGLPSGIKYVADAVVVSLLVMELTKGKLTVRRSLLPLVILVTVLFFYTLLVYLFRFQSPFYFLWGLRNNFRFYVAFFAFAAFVSEEQAKRYLSFLDILFWLNAALSIIQFVFLNVKQDFLGGIFGVGGGTNGYTLILMSIVVSKSVLRALNKETKLTYCVLVSITSLFVAAMAEMKFYFVLFVIMIGMASILTKFSFRKFLLLLIGSIAIFGCATLLIEWFEADGFLNLEHIIEIATKETYASREDVNRLSAVPTLASTVITNPLDQLFGLGLGNCDTSAFAICNTPFYQTYSYLHYTWFSVAMLFLEIGVIGICIFMVFYYLCFRYARRQIKMGTGNLLFCQLALMMSIVCYIIVFYNSSLRIELSYLIYFVLALPFMQKEAVAGSRETSIQMN